jgi:hypothetical protein
MMMVLGRARHGVAAQLARFAHMVGVAREAGTF